jgi:archaemetzincin
MTHAVQTRGEQTNLIMPPDINEVVNYLRAFYHGIDVRRLACKLSWVPWKAKNTLEHRSSARTAPSEVGLKTHKEIFRVRTRWATSKSKKITSGRDLFRYQVNQIDLLDVVETILPADACALLQIVDQDMYEDQDDDFCCGRAFGGSRIAVVSSARYNPVLDELQRVDRQHAWPTSHCADFVARACGRGKKGSRSTSSRRVRKTEEADGQNQTEGALGEALKAHLELSSKFDATTTYLLRVCRTASHEIGHCFGMDHCMYG